MRSVLPSRSLLVLVLVLPVLLLLLRVCIWVGPPSQVWVVLRRNPAVCVCLASVPCPSARSCCIILRWSAKARLLPCIGTGRYKAVRLAGAGARAGPLPCIAVTFAAITAARACCALSSAAGVTAVAVSPAGVGFCWVPRTVARIPLQP